MKKWMLFAAFICSAFNSFATHIAGGELIYTYIGPGSIPGTKVYQINLRLFRECHSHGQDLESETVNIGIYNKRTMTRVATVQLARNWTGNLPTISNTPGANPCLVGAPEVCYQLGNFKGSIELPDNADGYILSWIRYTRTTLKNVSGSFVGATFTTEIPGTNQIATGANSSAQFVIRDTAIICRQNGFSLDFSAVDPDGDSLSYEFAHAYDGVGGDNTNANPFPPPVLGFQILSYVLPYDGHQPLGSGVTINPKTGIISGTAPTSSGNYVVCVVANEWRQGVLINQHRKDFILSIEACDLAAAKVNLANYECNDFKTTFKNLSTSGAITGYLWNFGDPASGIHNTSTLANPVHTFSDTGIFKVRLSVFATGGCESKDSGYWHVFPGFTPQFSVVGSCYQSPFVFNDQTTATYGVVNKWSWDFGDPDTNGDVSVLRNPSYKYPKSGSYDVMLIVESSKGCKDTLVKKVAANDKPLLQLPFTDTLICSIDTLPISVGISPAASIKWTPAVNINKTNSPNVMVWPKDTIVYQIEVTEGLCSRKESLQINVLDFISVNVFPKDTVICKTDSIQLRPESHALQYIWTPPAALSDPSVKNPKAAPLTNTQYIVTANLGKCQDKDSIHVRVVPYPAASIAPADTLCHGDSIILKGSVVGSSFAWNPVTTLSNFHSLQPTAKPLATTVYVLTAFDTLGCPKPWTDSLLLVVREKVPAFAGNDTSVVAFQPLQLNGSGGAAYLWTPAVGLNNNTIANPVATLGGAIAGDSIRYLLKVTDAAGCVGFDTITVKIFKTQPDIFIPTGFTPNSDGRNDVLKAIPVGIKIFEYFKVFNRWGQQIFSTSDASKGWDGTVNGARQPSGTYVFMASGIDYLNRPVVKKGTVVLIR